MTRKTTNLGPLIDQFSHLYAYKSTFWIGIGCKGPIWMYQDHLNQNW